MRHAAWLLPLLLIGCSEYDLSADKDPAWGGEDSGDPTGTDGDTDGGDTDSGASGGGGGACGGTIV